MLEFLTEAIVLDKKPLGEQDVRVIFYTKDLGKVVARAISARKITSKLNAHLEPLNLALVRMVYKNEYRLTDAMLVEKFTSTPSVLKLVNFIDRMTAEHDCDEQLWQQLIYSLKSGSVSYSKLLQTLGFDPLYAVCVKCFGKPDFFAIEDLEFWCKNCQ